MNRLVLDTESIPAAKTSATFHHPGARPALEIHRPNVQAESSHATFQPIHYERKYAYPLLVWLHGSASNEHELRQIMPLVSMRNYVGVAPRGTSQKRQRGQYGWLQATDSIEHAEARITDAIAFAERRFNIHAKRVFLVGHDSGGTMALRVAFNDPARFAGAVAINAPLPARLRPLRRVNELRQLPCFLATSRDSQVYPTSRVCDDLRLLHAAGCTVALRQYPGGDGLTSQILSDLDHWLMELVCGAKSDS